METFWIKAAQLIVSLSIIIFLHELGHFGFARLFKTRVDKFYLFFNPLFSLIRCKKINGKWQYKFFSRNVPDKYRPVKNSMNEVVKDENGKPLMEEIPLEELPANDWRQNPESTEWGIGWLPFGGYCKIAGMIDESMDVEAMKKPAQPHEFRSQKAWKRLLIITGGVIVNFITALVIFTMILFVWGKSYLPMQNAKYGMQFTEVALKNGFKNGDIILNINGQHVENQGDVVEKLLIDKAQSVAIIRDGNDTTITLPTDFSQQILAAQSKQFMDPRFPFVIDDVVKKSPANSAGLLKGDSIIAINNKPVSIFQDVAQEFSLNKAKIIQLGIIRAGAPVTLPVAVDSTGKIGVYPKAPDAFLTEKTIQYGFLASIPAGISEGVAKLVTYVKSMKLLFTKAGATQIGGFGTIGSLFPPVWDWQSFWTLTAFISLILAFMNILPIPALDGGYMLFILVEMITGRKPSDKFLERANTIGFFILIALLLYANGNDIIRLFFKH